MPGEPLRRGPIAQSCFRYSYAWRPSKGMSSSFSDETAAAALLSAPWPPKKTHAVTATPLSTTTAATISAR